MAAVSHVPHLLAAALAATAAADPLAATLAAGSFRDGTRVAASRPELIAAMCGGNAAGRGPGAGRRPAMRWTRPATRSTPTTRSRALRPWLAAGKRPRRPPGRPGPASRWSCPARVDALLRLGRAGGWVTAVAADRRTVTAVRPG